MTQTTRTQIFEYATRSVTVTPFGVRWVPGTSKLVVAGEDSKAEGAVIVHELEPGSIFETSRLPTSVGIKSIAICDARSLATGDFRGDVSILDLESKKHSWKANKAHSQIVNSVDVCGGGRSGVGACELVTGSRDGTVKLWDPRVAASIAGIVPSQKGPDCWSVCLGNAFDEANRFLIAGYDNGDLKMFDLRTMTIFWETNVGNGICHVSFDRNDIAMNKLSVSCLEGQLIVYDMRTFHAKSGFAGVHHTCTKSTVWGCHPMPQDRDISAVAGGDGSLSLLKYSYPVQRCVKDSDGIDIGVSGTLEQICTSNNLATQPVVSFDWNADKKGLFAFSSFDQTVKVAVCSNLN